MSERIIIHIGLPKTGTSYLQVDVFPYIDKLQILRGWESFRKLMDVPKGNRILISDEYFSCRMFTKGIYEQFEDRLIRIKEVFNDPIIIVGFRKQKEFVLSYYKQYLHGGGDLDIDHVFNIQNSGILTLQDLYYKNWLDLLERNFNDVFVYSNETLQNNFNGFIKAFCDIIELDEPIIKDVESKRRNVGVRSVKQIEFLLEENRKPKKEGRNIFDRVYSKIGISRIKSPLEKALEMEVLDSDEMFELKKEVITFLDEMYDNDWNYIKGKLSY